MSSRNVHVAYLGKPVTIGTLLLNVPHLAKTAPPEPSPGALSSPGTPSTRSPCRGQGSGGWAAAHRRNIGGEHGRHGAASRAGLMAILGRYSPPDAATTASYHGPVGRRGVRSIGGVVAPVSSIVDPLRGWGGEGLPSLIGYVEYVPIFYVAFLQFC